MTPLSTEYRCKHCHKLLFKGVLVEGEIEAKCRACHEMTEVRATKFNGLLCMIETCPNRVHCPSVPQTT